MRRAWRSNSWAAAFGGCCMVAACLAGGRAVGGVVESPTALRLAVELDRQRDHAGAAVEFQRLALDAPEPAARAGYYWAAAYEYWKTRKYDLADSMLNRADSASDALGPALPLLRGENAAARALPAEAQFYLEDAVRAADAADLQALAARRLAAERVKQQDLAGARQALEAAPTTCTNGQSALLTYGAGHDKSVVLGGVLGIVPGLGYAYSGEYASALRSLILNGLFLFGVADTADKEEWGACAVIGFFEFTWYTGSIYGGIDAADRYNRQRLDDCVRGVNGASGFAPDFERLPLLSLRVTF